MALGEPAVGDRGLDAGRQIEEAERVRDGRACRADAIRDVLLAEPELLDQLAVGFRRLERIEILALEVLDEGELELLAIGELADDRGDAFETGRLGGAQPPLAGDELVAVDRSPMTRIGCRTPCSVMLAVRDASCSASNRLRG